MTKKLDIYLINDLLWKLKQVVLLQPEDETLIAVDRFIQFIKKREAWALKDPEK